MNYVTHYLPLNRIKTGNQTDILHLFHISAEEAQNLASNMLQKLHGALLTQDATWTKKLYDVLGLDLSLHIEVLTEGRATFYQNDKLLICLAPDNGYEWTFIYATIS